MGSTESRVETHYWLRALGPDEPPARVALGSDVYVHVRTFKHDFFAATAEYANRNRRIIVKLGRNRSCLGVPAAWIGRRLCRHEGRLYQLMQGIEGIPRFLGFWGPTGLAHEYVEGAPLAKHVPVDDLFFPRLAAILDAIHARDAAYVDLEKRENILLGDDGRPHLIDFQISWHVDPRRGGRLALFRCIRRLLQSSDRYHLLKHWRRARPDQLTAAQVAESYQPPLWISWHRVLFRPLTLTRRWVLVLLGERSSTRVRSPG